MTGVAVRPSAVLAEHREDVLSVVARHGGSNARVFGSVVRGEDRPGSDLDLLVEFPPGTSLLVVIALEQALRDLLEISVDVGPADSLRPDMRDRVLSEARPL